MFELLEIAIDSAIDSGAKYSDARVLISKSRSIAAKNGEIENFNENEKIGIGIRALVGSSWGFYSTYDLSSESLKQAGKKSFEIAKASAMVAGEELPFADVPVVEDTYTTPHQENPFSVSSSEQIDLLISSTEKEGADVKQINPANEDFSQQQHYKIPPTIVTNTSDDMKIMNEEIFGPVLPVLEYEDLNEAISTINSKDRPLGLYYFGTDKNEEDLIMNNTSSGGVTINNVVGHIQQKDLPFGGVGPSGMGRYQSFDGFKNFSNPRAFYKDVGFKFDKLFDDIRPPYTKSIENLLKRLLK